MSGKSYFLPKSLFLAKLTYFGNQRLCFNIFSQKPSLAKILLALLLTRNHFVKLVRFWQNQFCLAANETSLESRWVSWFNLQTFDGSTNLRLIIVDNSIFLFWIRTQHNEPRTIAAICKLIEPCWDSTFFEYVDALASVFLCQTFVIMFHSLASIKKPYYKSKI